MTLSSAAGETGFHEITVKREGRGLFSGWLFDRLGDRYAFYAMVTDLADYGLTEDEVLSRF